MLSLKKYNILTISYLVGFDFGIKYTKKLSKQYQNKKMWIYYVPNYVPFQKIIFYGTI